MINLLVKPEDEIVIKFVVAVDNTGKVFADNNKQALTEILKGSRFEMEEHKAVFRKPSFKDLMSLNASIYGTGDGRVSFNPMADRHQKMIKLIKSWTLKDSDGSPLTTSEENIGNLVPVVADVIATQLEAEMGGFLG